MEIRYKSPQKLRDKILLKDYFLEEVAPKIGGEGSPLRYVNWFLTSLIWVIFGIASMVEYEVYFFLLHNILGMTLQSAQIGACIVICLSKTLAFAYKAPISRWFARKYKTSFNVVLVVSCICCLILAALIGVLNFYNVVEEGLYRKETSVGQQMQRESLVIDATSEGSDAQTASRDNLKGLRIKKLGIIERIDALDKNNRLYYLKLLTFLLLSVCSTQIAGLSFAFGSAMFLSLVFRWQYLLSTKLHEKLIGSIKYYEDLITSIDEQSQKIESEIRQHFGLN